MAACSWASALFPFGLPCVTHGFVLAWSLRPASWVICPRHTVGILLDSAPKPFIAALLAGEVLGEVLMVIVALAAWRWLNPPAAPTGEP